MKTLFFGTPALAVPFLELLHQRTQVQAVMTSLDEPAGRGYEVQAPAVKKAALLLGLQVLQPANVRTREFIERVKEFHADVAIVVAYGKILPVEVLAGTTHGFLNVHFSLLPSYRGAGPIQHALINGEAETGVTLFWLDAGMDTGPIFLQKKIVIPSEDNADALRERLVALGLQGLEEGLAELEKGRRVALPQRGPASYAPLLKKEDGRIDWNQCATIVANRIRGVTPWPGAFCFAPSGNLKIRLKVLTSKAILTDPGGVPGSISIVEREKLFVVKCREGALEIPFVQPEGKKPMPSWSWLQGSRLKTGDKLE